MMKGMRWRACMSSARSFSAVDEGIGINSFRSRPAGSGAECTITTETSVKHSRPWIRWADSSLGLFLHDLLSRGGSRSLTMRLIGRQCGWMSLAAFHSARLLASSPSIVHSSSLEHWTPWLPFPESLKRTWIV